jgi:hypothetical protein
MNALFERQLARMLRAKDPGRALAAASRDRRLPAELRRALAAADPDGVRMTALLVLRLRFERLLRGSAEATASFAAAPAAFTRAFRRYHTEVAPTAFFPLAEALLYRTWLRGHVRSLRRTGTMSRARGPGRRLTGGAGPNTGSGRRSPVSAQ